MTTKLPITMPRRTPPNLNITWEDVGSKSLKELDWSLFDLNNTPIITPPSALIAIIQEIFVDVPILVIRVLSNSTLTLIFSDVGEEVGQMVQG